MGSILGNRVQRVEDPRMLTVGGTYVEDVDVDAAWVHFVRSEYAHGRILSYDIDDARKVPGVLGVFTGDDLDLPPFPHVQPILKPGSERPLIAKGTVRFVGEPVVAIVAVDRPTAVDAGALVYVDIKPLTAVVDLDDALSDATLVHPALETNTYASFTSEHQADFSECEVVLDLRVVNQHRSIRGNCSQKSALHQINKEWRKTSLDYVTADAPNDWLLQISSSVNTAG